MSWRERSLLALFVHLLAAVLVLVVPRLQFVQDAAERRAQRLAQVVEEQRLAQRQDRQDEPRFMFVQPLVDLPAPTPPPQANLSDIDRVARSSAQAETPINDLPNADGNSPNLVEAVDPSESVNPVAESGEDLDAAAAEADDPPGEPLDGVDDGADDGEDDRTVDASQPEGETTLGDRDALANPFLDDSREASRARRATERSSPIFGEALRGRQLKGLTRKDSFLNLQGRTDQYGSDIQFDTKGVDFGSWIRRFRALIYKNWRLPYAIWSMSGHVVLTFNVHRDGAMTELVVLEPSAVDGFTNSAHNALRQSNPVPALPDEYPDDTVFFTVIFYFNEQPPGR